MKNNKILILLLCVVSLFIFTACGSEEKKEETNNENKKEEKEEKKEELTDFLLCYRSDDDIYTEIAFYYDKETHSEIQRYDFSYEYKDVKKIEGYEGVDPLEIQKDLEEKICSNEIYFRCNVMTNRYDLTINAGIKDGYKENDVMEINNAPIKENKEYYESQGYECKSY